MICADLSYRLRRTYDDQKACLSSPEKTENTQYISWIASTSPSSLRPSRADEKRQTLGYDLEELRRALNFVLVHQLFHGSTEQNHPAVSGSSVPKEVKLLDDKLPYDVSIHSCRYTSTTRLRLGQ